MLLKKGSEIFSSEITPKSVYLTRRAFIAGASVAVAALAGERVVSQLISPSGKAHAGTKLNGVIKGPFSTSEQQTPYNDVTHYNNFYEFGTGKNEPAEKAKNFSTSPWTVSVEGNVNQRRKFDLDSLMKLAPLEERIYRHRCVEAWSIVVPWIGFPLNVLLKQVEPTSKAKYVAFQTLYDPRQMPAGAYAGIPFPYVEGLRLDEAMHPLTILCFGMYGEVMPKQNGAPIRLHVPWKYGFKSIKSIVKIRFVEKQPMTSWELAAPYYYAFCPNVNPAPTNSRFLDQSSERRIGEFLMRKTAIFNGYGDQVAGLYTGMDLRQNY